MHNTSVSLSIPDPCGQAWDAMQPVTGGRFCGSCKQTVVDFTGMSDREIYDTLQTGSACGKFRPDQLQLSIGPVSGQTKQPWLRKWALSLLLLTGMAPAGKAQGLKKDSVQTDQMMIPQSDLNIEQPKKSLVLTGHVTSQIRRDLPRAEVILYEGDRRIGGAVSDPGGDFTINYTRSTDAPLLLKVSYGDALHILNGPFDGTKALDITLLVPGLSEENVTLGLVIHTKQETRWQRTKRKARNLFR